MVKTISAAQADREFSKLMKIVESGEDVVVTSRGKPRVRIIKETPADDEAALRRKAFDEFTEWLKSRPIRNLPRLTRDDVYDRCRSRSIRTSSSTLRASTTAPEQSKPF